MKKIAIVDSSLGPGGAEKLIVDMAPIMVEKGYDVEVVILSSYKDVFSTLLTKNNIKVTFLSDTKNYWSLLNLYKLYKVLRSKDIVYTHVVHAQYFTALISLFLPSSIKLVTTEHSTHNRRRNKKIFYFIERFIYSKYDKVIAITQQVKLNLINHLQKEDDKIIVIENGINLEMIKSAKAINRKEFNYSDNDILIVMIGRFSPAKDQKTLIKAMSHLDDNYKLLLIGEGELMDENKKLVKHLNIADKVNFLGFRNNIPELIKMCDIGVLSSHWEGQPLSVIEIMASGIPFVGSRVAGITELAENYGVLFEEHNEYECAEVISKLAIDNEYYKAIVDKCLKRSEDYSVHKMVDKYLNIFNDKEQIC